MAFRPIGATQIVDGDDILSNKQIILEKLNFNILLPHITSIDLCLSWLAKRRLIRNSCLCSNCAIPTGLRNNEKDIDENRWECCNCRFVQSVREGSFFERGSLQLKQIMIIIYFWSLEAPLAMIENEATVDSDTVLDWCFFLREECGKYLERHKSPIGGVDEAGDPIEVEIGTTNFFQKTHQNKKTNDEPWLFGGIERGSKKFFIVVVPDQRAATLQAIIEQHIMPGTHIISNEWAAFANISKICHGIYSHTMSRHFVDPTDKNIHTQNIKNMWMRMKKKLVGDFDSNDVLFLSHLDEFHFRSAVGTGNVFSAILTSITESFPM